MLLTLSQPGSGWQQACPLFPLIKVCATHASAAAMQKLSVGAKIWGVVSAVHLRELAVSLPHGLRGQVTYAEVIHSAPTSAACSLQCEPVNNLLRMPACMGNPCAVRMINAYEHQLPVADRLYLCMPAPHATASCSCRSDDTAGAWLTLCMFS